jgi:hypothetical protein
VLSGAVLGLDGLLAGERPPRWFRHALAVGCAAVAAWAAYRALVPPPTLRAMMEEAVQLASMGRPAPPPFGDVALLLEAETRMARLSLLGVGWAASASLLWVFLQARKVVFAACILAVLEVVAMARGVNPQRDPALYYPTIPALAALSGRPWGRALCVQCMPPDLLTMTGSADVRGYDGADPIRWVQLMYLFQETGASTTRYARLLNFAPRLPSPIADLLGVRYLVYRGTPPPDIPVISRSPDYYVVENPRALPRAFVPERVEASQSAVSTLYRLSRSSFDPRKLALLETRESLPAGLVRGSAVVVADHHTRLSIDVRLESPGAVVIIDRWDPGWQATYQGAEVEVLRADHALRAVLLPAGEGRLELRYAPESFAVGLQLAAAALAACVLLGLLSRVRRQTAMMRARSSSTRPLCPARGISSDGSGTTSP